MSVVADPQVPTSVRLDTRASQRAFRILLDAFSRPGRAVDLAVVASEAGVDPALVPILALADIEVSVAVVGAAGRADAVERLVHRSTGARIVADLGNADMVLADDRFGADQVAALRRGDAWTPESGSRLVLRCHRLFGDDDEPHGPNPAVVRLAVTGPGARDVRHVGVVGVPVEVFEALRSANLEHPAGVDTWLVADDGLCVGLPRSSDVRIELGAR
ncbi:phosphonate C-P lyase system protein PhnH [Ilumatobacter sp.]|uniref:phosphonate C-P lyase system protein PhnH n=1 Tax=Ilumatobacter sp. TaxID=1967498 RepID=UPI003C65A6A4